MLFYSLLRETFFDSRIALNYLLNSYKKSNFAIKSSEARFLSKRNSNMLVTELMFNKMPLSNTSPLGKANNMRNMIFSIIIISVAVFVYFAYDHTKDSKKEKLTEPVISNACEWLGKLDWTEGTPPSDTFFIDGEMCFGCMPIKGAERTFDTVINHSHVHFIKEK